MEIPFSDQNLKEASPDLTLDYLNCPAEQPPVISKITVPQELEQLDWKSVFALGEVEGQRCPLVLKQRKLYTLLKDYGRDRPLRVSCSLLLLGAENRETLREVTLDYLPDDTALRAGYWQWKHDHGKIEADSLRPPGFAELGTLVAAGRKQPDRGPSFVLRLITDRNEPFVLRAEHLTSLLLGKQKAIGRADGLAGFQFVEFPIPLGGNLNFRIARQFLADNRIQRLELTYELLTGDMSVREVALQELGEEPLVTIQGITNEDGELQKEDILAFRDRTGIYPPGKIIVEVLDPRGTGYNIPGKLINTKDQLHRPFEFKGDGPGFFLATVVGDYDEAPQTEREFTLTNDKQNLVDAYPGQRYALRYRHELPLQVQMGKLDFTRSATGQLEVTTALKIAGATDRSLKFLIKGGNTTELSGLPKAQREAALTYTTDVRQLRLERMTFRNANSVAGQEVISVRIGGLRLLDRATGEVASDWEAGVRAARGAQQLSEGITLLPTLAARETARISIDLTPMKGLSSRAEERRLSLDYWIDHLVHQRAEGEPLAGDTAPAATVRTVHRVDLSLAPLVNRTYVSIDLGTSAIVAAVSDDLKGNFEFDFLDLQKRLAELRRAAGEDYNEAVQTEHGTSFIASNLILLNKRRIDADSLKDSSIQPAPPPLELLGKHKQWLPNLKMIFGRDGLAKLKEPFNGKFTYTVGRETRHEPADSQAVIDQALHALIHLLIEGFVKPQPGVRRNPDNLLDIVFTVPNNFTPAYRERIRHWASRPRTETEAGIKVSFVSESDAVAYSYLDYWSELHPDRKSREPETILAYDIGAGTSDLSLIRRSYSAIDRTVLEIKMLGRLGLPKAGNYLDFLLAKIVLKHYGHDAPLPIFQALDYFDVNRDFKEVLSFHRWIRDELKPHLAGVPTDASTAPFPVATEHTEDFILGETAQDAIDLLILIKDEEFQAYLRSVSETALDKLVRISHGRNTNVGIDTILFSGRSIQMNCLREAVINAVVRYADSDNPPTIIYADRWPLRRDNNLQSTLKGLVALGGIRYLRRYRDPKRSREKVRIQEQLIDAGYGIFFDDSDTATPNYRYVSILVPRQFHGYGRTYEVDVDLKSAQRLYLLQTYEHDARVIERYYDSATNRFSGDYIVNLLDEAAVYPRQRGAAAGDIKYVTVTLHEENVMTFEFLNAERECLFEQEIRHYRRGYNPFSPEATQSLWPIITEDIQA